MDRNRVRRLWEDVSATYADRRDPDGSDANLPDGSVGVDFARAGLDLAAGEVPAARLLQGDMLQLPLREGIADAVTAYHAVFHVGRERHPEVYAEFARVLKPGGWLLMTLPSGRFETVRRGWMGGSMFFSAPGRDRTLAALADANFEDIETVTADDPLGSSTEFVFARRG